MSYYPSSIYRFQMSYYPEYDFKQGQEPKQTELLIDIKTKTIRTDVDLDDAGRQINLIPYIYQSIHKIVRI